METDARMRAGATGGYPIYASKQAGSGLAHIGCAGSIAPYPEQTR